MYYMVQLLWLKPALLNEGYLFLFLLKGFEYLFKFDESIINRTMNDSPHINIFTLQ